MEQAVGASNISRNDEVGLPVEAIAGGGGVVVICIVVALSIVIRRSIRKPVSSQTMQNGNTTFQADIIKENETESKIKRKSSEQNQPATRQQANEPTSVKQQVSTHEETAFQNENGLEIDDESNGVLDTSSTDDHTYYNELGTSSNKSKIPIDQLVKYVDGKNHEAFVAEFEGYKKPKQYIATLGPMSKQLEDFSLFWKMIWQQRVEKIVMVTNLVENGSPKCEQYWPNQGASKTYGDIKVESRSEDEYAEFTRRAFTVAMEQYQFLHTAVVYSLTFDCKQIKGENFDQYMSNHSTQELNNQFNNIGIYYPAANQDVLKKETFEVSCSREEQKTFYSELTLTIQHKGAGEQFVFCHGCVSEYLSSFDVYANFSEKTGNI
ncbi:PTPRT-like protein [Mya arenaria]|uniref:protein-tyrosine-phosphatase n=1 Tax=Mya arenaria TaxID=6604 RepID=A0ABY7F7M9_MYAAR|nr:PTPRT-like protein [Mya arenaria]